MSDKNHVRTILCVDGDVESRETLEAILSDYELVFARNAFEALRSVNRRSFHAYILEHWVADWSGVALCREIRKSDRQSPIVFVTGAARDSDRLKAMRAGATDYLCKPVDPTLLRAKLQALTTLAEMESVQAKVAEQRAVQEELDRRMADVRAHLASASALLASSIERTARTRARKAFIGAHGTPAFFEAWWADVYGDAWGRLGESNEEPQAEPVSAN